MNRLILVFTFVLLSLFTQVCAQNIKEEIVSIENSFKAFEYKNVIQKGKFLLADPYTSAEDSTLIYQYMLSSAYALNDTIQAKEFILDLLNNRPDFSLNPINTSPKIVEFFNLIKKNYIGKTVTQQPDSAIIQYPVKFEKPKSSTIILGALFPGMAHLIEGDKRKGVYYSTISGILLGSSTYFIFKTNSDRETYMNAGDGADFDKLYSTYNTSYKTRNALALAYGIWSLYCLFEFNKNYMFQPKFESDKQSLSLTWQYLW